MNIRPIVFLLLAGVVSAATINNIDITADETGHVSVKEVLVVPGGAAFFETWIPENSESIAVADPAGSLSFNRSTVGNRTYLGISIPVAARKRDVTLSYTSRYLTTKSAGVWKLAFFVPSTPHRTIVKITLPFNSTILDWEPKFPFSPSQGGIYVFPETDGFNFTITYSFEGVQAPTPTDYRPLLGLAILVVVIIAVLLFLRLRKKETKAATEEETKPSEEKKRVKESVIKMLEENERKIVEILQDADEEITQATIYNQTHMPKASLSDLMRRLERRNILERTREGRRNWVKLKEWVFD